MKSIGIALVFLLTSILTYAQKPDVEVYEKKEGEKVIVIARNTGKSDYNVKINISSQGMDVTPASTVEASVRGGFMKEMAVITPRPGEIWSYDYNVTITQTIAKTPSQTTNTSSTPTSTPSAPKQPSTNSVHTSQNTTAPVSTLSNADIILYAKPGCGRCTYAKKQLAALGIQYLEVNTQSQSPEVSNMWAQMRSQGFTGGSVTMPVMRVNGQYHYDIKDLEGFIGKLKS
ncbi:MAG TPA: glutaredoxin [Saprospiraceae bacterium]|nr:glutaredoxin [Saprospiraceae bacterium]